ncbi:MAG: heavy metal translocating P-type ATPase, partial [Aquificaceae bacterium]
MRASLKVSGMTCVNCARAIEISLKKLRGVEHVQVSFELGRVVVEFNEELLGIEQIKSVIESLGYRVEGVTGRSRSLELLLFCWLSSLLIMALMLWHSPPSLYLQAFLSAGVQALGGYSFYRGAISSLKARVGNMDLLVALGSTSALFYSLLAMMGTLHGEPFFETSAFLITFVKTGKFLEEWVRARALKSLRELFGIQTMKVKVMRKDREEERSLQEVFVGDTLILRTGEMVPVDCRVLEGSLEVDESLITGESVPVLKRQDEKLISGSLVVSGYAKARVERTFASSYTNLLVRMVEETLSKKPRIQRLADRFSHYFVQFVVVLAVVVFLLWFLKTGDLQRAVSFSLAVLVVSCPCAFGIAVPLALTVGLFRAYRQGVLIKDPSALEKHPDLVVMDKTGTLTEGKPRLLNFRLYREDALSLACGLAQASNHPYSLALRDYCLQKGITAVIVGNCREEAGVGVLCEDYLLGRSEEGVALYRNGTKLAEFYFEDSIRPEAKEILSFLRSKGVDVFMLTGDNEEKARLVAQELGIENFMAGAKPEDKLRVVENFQQKGLKVAVVGDGINDAPAMARADLSFAIGSGTDMAKRAGDVVLLKGIEGIKTFFDYRDRTIRRIRQNLFWAFVYNLLGIPIAGGLLYNEGVYFEPELAGLMMA